jgi:predicted ATPase/class 3 adenylate cyclase
VRCPRCQQENRPEAKFCEECAAPLVRTCPNCGNLASPSAKFCSECAHPLSTAAPPKPRFGSPDVYTPKHLADRILMSKAALEGERKQVTVLFADIKGSMELLAERDPEEARKLLDPVLERMMEAVHRYEGTVNQVMGDGIMALFGAPLAHEDHAVRACYAAIDMQVAIRRYAEEVRRTQGINMQARVGLNSGEVVVRAMGSDLRMDYSAVGQSTHLAARMEQLADPGFTLLTAETLRLAEGYIEVRPLGPVPVKGLEPPIEVYQMLGPGPQRSRLHAAAARGLTRFVGREVELEQLRLALSRTAAGHGQVVAIVGEPGVGKSRLVWEITHSHRTHGWLILHASSVSYGKATPYLPTIDLLKTYCQVEDLDDGRRIREKVMGKALNLDELLKPAVPPLLWLLDVPVDDPSWHALDPPQRRQRALDAVKRLLLRESQVQPLLVVFEDLHWIDDETQALLDNLVASLPTARLLLLVNYRPGYQHGWGSKTYYTQLRLDPLPPESAQSLLRVLLGDDAGLQPLKQLLIERTDGNPFFLEECVRALSEVKALVGERGAFRLARPLQRLDVPPTVHAVLAARIDRLPPEDKRLLQAASVIGETVPFALLQALAELSDRELSSYLGRLQADEFLYESSLFPDLEYSFKHGLTYQVTYNSLVGERRRALHTRILDAIERLYPDRLNEQVERLAHHAMRAEEWPKAVAYYRRAGIKAAARSAHSEAITHLTTALELLKRFPHTPDRAKQELDLQTALGPVFMASKGFAAPEVEHAYGRARELCREVGQTQQLFPTLHGLWRFYVNRAAFKPARALAEEALTVAQRVEEPALLLEAHRALGQTMFWLGEPTSTRGHMDEAMALYDSERHRSHTSLYGQDPGVVCRSFAAWTLWLLGYPDAARHRIQEAVRLAQEVAHPFSFAYSLMCAAVVHWFLREDQAARKRAEAVMALSREQGFPFWLIWGRILRGWALAVQGQGEEGITEIQEGLTAYQVTGAEVFRPSFLCLLAEAYGHMGESEKQLSTLAEALAAVHRSGETWWKAELHRLTGESLLASRGGNSSEVEASFHQSLYIARRQQAKSLELRAALSLSRLWHRNSKRQEARELLGATYGWFTEGPDTADLRDARMLLEELS